MSPVRGGRRFISLFCGAGRRRQYYGKRVVIMIVGVIGDTHGVLHPGVKNAFNGVDKIVHAGDIGGVKVLTYLGETAKTIAVRGNYDTEPEIQEILLKDPSVIELAGRRTLLTHRMFTMGWDSTREFIAARMNETPGAPEIVIFGHIHFPVLEQVDGIWFVNPGYCGPDPLEGPSTVIRLEITEKKFSGEIIHL